jgi:RNA polymerase I-specific transcription initiation factor RRN6
MLRSRLNNLTQTYTFTHSSFNADAPVSSATPTLVNLTTGLTSHTIGIAIEPCRYQGDTVSSELGLGRTYFARGLRFYKAFMLQSDLSVHETILYVGPSPGADLEHEAVEDVTWTRAYQPRNDARIALGDEMDNFLEPEGIEAMNKPITNFAIQSSESEEEESMISVGRVVDHRLIYDALTRKHRGSETASIDVPTITARVRQSLVEPASYSQLSLGTM